MISTFAFGESWSLYRVINANEVKLLKTDKGEEGISSGDLSIEFKIVKFHLKGNLNATKCLLYKYETENKKIHSSSVLIENDFVVIDTKKITLLDLMQRIEKVGVKKVFHKKINKNKE